MRVALSLLLFGSVLLSGCALSSTGSRSVEQGTAITGAAHGGQQPIVGAHVYLMQAGTSGYGAASVSLLNPLATLQSDSVGAYVTTGTDGSFTITGEYACLPGTQVYLLALQGNAGAGNNTALSEMGVFGQCPAAGSFAGTLPFVQINEATTVAAAYALAGFAIDALHVSSSGTAAAQVGIANAFATAGNIASITSAPNTGALTTTPGGLQRIADRKSRGERDDRFGYGLWQRISEYNQRQPGGGWLRECVAGGLFGVVPDLLEWAAGGVRRAGRAGGDSACYGCGDQRAGGSALRHRPLRFEGACALRPHDFCRL